KIAATPFGDMRLRAVVGKVPRIEFLKPACRYLHASLPRARHVLRTPCLDFLRTSIGVDQAPRAQRERGLHPDRLTFAVPGRGTGIAAVDAVIPRVAFAIARLRPCRRRDG